MSEAAGIGRVAVIGTGTIGASWAALFLARGLHVVATDPAPGAEALLRQRVEAVWPVLEKLGPVAPQAPARLRFVTDPADAVRDAQFTQENGPEREELKLDLFKALDRAAPADAIIASSSSGLLMSRLQQAC